MISSAFCAFCDEQAVLREAFIEERRARLRPLHLPVWLTVCSLHQDPFRSDESGAIAQAIRLPDREGARVIVGRADTSVWTSSRRFR